MIKGKILSSSEYRKKNIIIIIIVVVVKMFCFKLFVKNSFVNSPKLKDKTVKLISYKHIGGNTPLIYKTVGDVLDKTAEKYGDRTAIVSCYQNKIWQKEHK